MQSLPCCPRAPSQPASCLPPLPRCSERLARSQAEGQRQKEACNINKSLSSLGDVFQVGAASGGAWCQQQGGDG